MFAAFKGKCHHCGHEPDEGSATVPPIEILRAAREVADYIGTSGAGTGDAIRARNRLLRLLDNAPVSTNTPPSAPVGEVTDLMIDAALSASWKAAGFNGINPRFWNGVDRKRMRAALTAALRQAGGGWSDPKSAPPKEREDVLACWWQGDRCVSHLSDGSWWYRGNHGLKRATIPPVGWMPLPPPQSPRSTSRE